jgi:hypothetical protein
MLTFDCIVCDAHRCGVVAMDGGFGLSVTHICKGESKNNPCLAIVVEGAQFCFGGGGNNEMQNHGADMESSIQTNGLSIFWHPPHEKITTRLALGIRFQKIGGIQVDIQDHVGSVELDLCIQVSRQVIQQLGASRHCFFHHLYLFDCDGTEGHQHRHIDCPHII